MMVDDGWVIQDTTQFLYHTKMKQCHGETASNYHHLGNAMHMGLAADTMMAHHWPPKVLLLTIQENTLTPMHAS